MYIHLCTCTCTHVRNMVVHMNVCVCVHPCRATGCLNAEPSGVMSNTSLPLPVVRVECVVRNSVSEGWCVYVENAHECVCVCVCVYTGSPV